MSFKIDPHQLTATDKQIAAFNEEMTALRQRLLKIQGSPSQKDRSEGDFEKIPNELLKKILGYLPQTSLAASSKVNVRWNDTGKKVTVSRYYKNPFLSNPLPSRLTIDEKYQIVKTELSLQKCHAVFFKNQREVEKWGSHFTKVAACSLGIAYLSLCIFATPPDSTYDGPYYP